VRGAEPSLGSGTGRRHLNIRYGDDREAFPSPSGSITGLAANDWETVPVHWMQFVGPGEGDKRQTRGELGREPLSTNHASAQAAGDSQFARSTDGPPVSLEELASRDG